MTQTVTELDTPPATGWLADLNAAQLRNLIGATVHVTSGAKQTTGLVLDVGEGNLFLFRADHAEPLTYPVCSTAYSRIPGTPMRPALARALIFQQAWADLHDALTDSEGKPYDQDDYDAARDIYVHEMGPVYDDVVTEYSQQPSVIDIKEEAA